MKSPFVTRKSFEAEVCVPVTRSRRNGPRPSRRMPYSFWRGFEDLWVFMCAREAIHRPALFAPHSFRGLLRLCLVAQILGERSSSIVGFVRRPDRIFRAWQQSAPVRKVSGE